MLHCAVGKRGTPLSFRTKLSCVSPCHYAFVSYENEEQYILEFPGTIYGAAWKARVFVPRACDFCADCFAEDADITFMDAWLPEYEKDPKGTSLVVARKSYCTALLRELQQMNAAKLWAIDGAKVIQSQNGVVQFKRRRLPARVDEAIRLQEEIPKSLSSIRRKASDYEHRQIKRFRRNRMLSNAVWNLRVPSAFRLLFLKFILATSEAEPAHRVNALCRRIAKRVLGRHSSSLKNLLHAKRLRQDNIS